LVSEQNLDSFLTSLKEAGVNLNQVYAKKEGNTPVSYAIREGGTYDSVKALLDHGADPTGVVGDLSYIQIALIAGNRDIARLLSSKGATLSLDETFAVLDKLNVFED
jgi:ankyrin repeat protein